MPVKIITDSTSDIPPDLAKQYNIDIIPMYVIMKGQSYRDGIDIKTDELYQFLEECADDEIPVTSHPSVQDFRKTFTKAAASSQAIIYLSATGKLSKAYDHALLAARDFGQLDIQIVDTGTGAGAEGLLAIEAATLAKQGADSGEIVKAINHAKNRTELIGVLETLKYLQKGGRIGRAQSLLGSLLSIKPVITLKDGEATPLVKVRTREKGLIFIIDRIKDKINELKGQRIRVFIEVAKNPEWSQEICERIKAVLPVEAIWQSSLTPAMGIHTGPGLWIVSYHIL